ncbi:hypothetical protein [Nonomuraea insulae]|uniref:Chromosome partition protein Smc n=1 Tax=Nonomuraea insulae TaxID=1616787 RepID=A0ABW1CY48_9ACTN
MSFKEIALQVSTQLDNEFVRIRADQLAMGQQLTEKIDGVAQQVKVLDSKFTQLDGRVGVLETRFDRLEVRFDRLETRFDGLEARVGSLETKVDRLDTKVDGLQENQTEMMHILIAIQRKLEVN